MTNKPELEVVDRHGRRRRYRRGEHLADGERLVTPMLFMDAAPGGFRPTFSDGSPDHTSPHRPGFRFGDCGHRDAAEDAYRERSQRLQNAWRKESREGAGRDRDHSLQYADAAGARRAADQAYAERRARLANAWRSR
jgi:hypothetical protein